MADNANCWSAVDGPAVETRAPCVNGLEILVNPNSGQLFNKETHSYKMMNEPQNERVSHSDDMPRMEPQCVWGMQRGPEAGGGTREVTGPPHPVRCCPHVPEGPGQPHGQDSGWPWASPGQPPGRMGGTVIVF